MSFQKQTEMFISRILALVLFATTTSTCWKTVRKRALQKSHEKPQEDKWVEAFFGKITVFDQVPSLVNLVNWIAQNYLKDCTTVFLYDEAVEKSDGLLLEQLFRQYPFDYLHGQISKRYVVKQRSLLHGVNKCLNYIMFVADVMRCNEVIGEQNLNKVVVIARSSQWRVYEFLANDKSQGFINLLVVSQSEKTAGVSDEAHHILYTHDLYTDGIGTSKPKVLTSWIRGNLTRPYVNLFPQKIDKGFQGHRFIVSVANQPPFVLKRGVDDGDNIKWDGSEVRLINLLARTYNFTTELREARSADLIGAGDAVALEVKTKKANIGLSGIYVTQERIGKVDFSFSHSQDCAAFISLTSTALPRYRAIMGPFHWTVWLALSFTYLFAILPISFSDRHTFRHLFTNPEEIENMFWYVFGTFTNCFTFTGAKSWNKSKKVTTRILVGFYWIFTIITTACYTGSIIAFVTLPIFPQTIDTVKQLMNGKYQIGTLDKGGWQYWFNNSTDLTTLKLLKDVEYLPDVESGLKNTTRAFFWPYSFLGSRAQLDYIVRTNFTTTSKRALLHISKECFVPYGVAIAFQRNSVYKNILDKGILQAFQSGLMIKFTHDVEWDIMRSATGKLLQASSGTSLRSLAVDDRALTLDDTQGMFLLLGAGFLLGGAALVSEWFGGCFKLCKKRRPSSKSSINSNPRSFDTPTPREKINSIQYSTSRLNSIIDLEFDASRRGSTFPSRGDSIEEIVDNEILDRPNHSRMRKGSEYADKLSNLSDIFDKTLESIEKSSLASEQQEGDNFKISRDKDSAECPTRLKQIFWDGDETSEKERQLQSTWSPNVGKGDLNCKEEKSSLEGLCENSIEKSSTWNKNSIEKSANANSNKKLNEESTNVNKNSRGKLAYTTKNSDNLNDDAANSNENLENSNKNAAISNVKSAISNGKSAISNEHSSISNGQSVILNGQSEISNGPSAISNGQSAISNGQLVISNGKSDISNRNSAILNENSAKMNENSAVSNENLTYSNAYSAISNENSVSSNRNGNSTNSNSANSNRILNSTQNSKEKLDYLKENSCKSSRASSKISNKLLENGHNSTSFDISNKIKDENFLRNIEKEIDDLFDFDELFGEKNEIDDDTIEELNDNGGKPKSSSTYTIEHRLV